MRRASQSAFRFVAVVGDAAIAAGALGLAFWLRTRVHIPGTEMLLPLQNVRFTPGNVFLVGAAQVVSLSLFGLYGARERFRDPLGRLLIPALFFQLLALSAMFFLAFAQAYAFPRSVLVLYLVVNGIGLALWRLLLERMFPQRPRRAIAVVDEAEQAAVADVVGHCSRVPWS